MKICSYASQETGLQKHKSDMQSYFTADRRQQNKQIKKVSSTARQYKAAHRSELSSFAQRYLTQNQTTLDTSLNIDAPGAPNLDKYQKLSLAHNFLSNVGSQFNFYSVKTERAGQSHNSDIHLNDLIGNYPIGSSSKSEEPTLRDKLHKKFLPKEKRPGP